VLCDIRGRFFKVLKHDCASFLQCVHELEGAFALVFKSTHFPNEAVAARRGSPLLVGIKV
jgi:glucosamine 6-phosphate synthetase-like amidotransferase/phosphosugar isomerase protein